jgi:hypothetical protein
MKTILAPEILAHVTPARALRAGDLAVFTDHAGRTIGCRIVKIHAAGTLSSTAQIQVRVAGVASIPLPYFRGMPLTIDADKVRGAL